jgi:hypothetical protein
MGQELAQKLEATALRITSKPLAYDTGAEEVKVQVRREAWRHCQIRIFPYNVRTVLLYHYH